MAAVKGSKQYKLRVVKYRPLLWWSFTLLVMCVVSAGVYGSYHFGVMRGMADQEVALADVARLTADLDASQAEKESLQQQLANIKLGAEVDRQSNEDVRQEVIALKEKLAQLEEDNSFYRNLMAPTQNQRGLSIGSVEIGDTDVARNYRYKVVMQQLATNHQLLNGSLKFTVYGKLNGFDTSYELHELSPQVSTPEVKLRFKYFQNVEGRLELPEGFDPERIELVAQSTGRNSVTVEKRFGWLVEETST